MPNKDPIIPNTDVIVADKGLKGPLRSNSPSPGASGWEVIGRREYNDVVRGQCQP